MGTAASAYPASNVVELLLLAVGNVLLAHVEDASAARDEPAPIPDVDDPTDDAASDDDDAATDEDPDDDDIDDDDDDDDEVVLVPVDVPEVDAVQPAHVIPRMNHDHRPRAQLPCCSVAA